MKKIKVFYHDECPNQPGKYMIRVDLDKFHLEHTEGSFNIIGARLMGLTYANYLRMCRDIYGAEIIGKNSNYPYPVFNTSSAPVELINELNSRANLILENRKVQGGSELDYH